MVQIGDEVVIMSAPGRFTVIAIDGPVVTIETADGVRKTVLQQAVRDLPKSPSD
jgi:preprotein translocase subunit YajC